MLLFLLNDSIEGSSSKEYLRNIWNLEIASVVKSSNFSSSRVNNFFIMLFIYFFSFLFLNDPKLNS